MQIHPKKNMMRRYVMDYTRLLLLRLEYIQPLEDLINLVTGLMSSSLKNTQV